MQRQIIIEPYTLWTREIAALSNDSGNGTNQLSYPDGFFLDLKTNTIYVADTENNRIMCISDGASIEGVVIMGENGKDNVTHQLSSTHDVALDSNGNLYVSDIENN